MNRLLPVSDPDDPRLEPYRAVRDRDLAGRPGRFVAEGSVVVRLLLGPSSRFAAESVLLAAGRVARSADLLERVPAGVPVFVAEPAVMDRVVGFPIHRGVLAVGQRREGEGTGALPYALPDRAVAVVLAGIANHDNVGAVFRNAAAFGACAVLLDGASCDPLYRKAIRVSVGTALTVPFRHGGPVDGHLDGLARLGFVPVALSPRGAGTVASTAWPDRTAFVVGTEGSGLPARLLERLRTVSIPMAAGFDSLNLATATGIALHAWRTSGLRETTRPPAD